MNIDIVSWKATTILLTGTSWNADPISIINSPTDSVMFVKWSLNIHRIHLKNNHGVDTLSSEISALTKSPCSRSRHELTVKLTSKTRLLNHDLICWQKKSHWSYWKAHRMTISTHLSQNNLQQNACSNDQWSVSCNVSQQVKVDLHQVNSCWWY